MELSTLFTSIASEILPSFVLKIGQRGTFFARTYFYKLFFLKKFRISLSGLIHIKASNGKYLLVESKKFKGRYQLPGGVFFWFDSWKDLSVLQEDDVMSGVPKKDMRFKVRSGKEYKIAGVLAKFETTIDREREPRREFFEELISTSILPKNIFNNPSFNYKCTHQKDFDFYEGLLKSEYCSFYRYEMFELVMNDDQQKYIDDLAATAPVGANYIFASKNEIKKGLILSNGQKINFPDYIKELM